LTAVVAVVLTVCGVAAAAGLASQGTYPPPLPKKAERIIEHDWCSAGSYARARRVSGLTQLARQNLTEAERVARAHPRGCLLAEQAARNTRERIPRHFPFTRRRALGDCPLHPLPLGRGARTAAAAPAARFEGRPMRPVIVGYNARLAQVRFSCGRKTARRTVVVDMTLTAMLPSASLSERDVAVSHIRGHGWRVWAVLH
jgi:hypothetical protein